MAHQYGSVEVITGSMFCGKTEELIRRLRRATIARQKVQVFKPIIDDRYAFAKVTSHSGTDFDALPIGSSGEILAHLEPGTTVVGIDEAQFFDETIVSVIEETGSSWHPRYCHRVGYGFSRRTFWLHARSYGKSGKG